MMNTYEYTQIIADVEAVETAGFDAVHKFAVECILFSLRYLQILSERLSKPIENITASDIISAFRESKSSCDT